ncbi:hypothetical protein HO173_003211 [Letharia columbiana]|uniref:Uncharacterized protein n=1 Tax=Letharia columbiana TaxID=112416 RepID=A0A8H6G1P0_9LECA|nr:uncharacterized protein HO173_003211 [Letharia columbiana]KAF6238705.1 hypothetical protein HO173_003211 [Letharia columbiana]
MCGDRADTVVSGKGPTPAFPEAVLHKEEDLMAVDKQHPNPVSVPFTIKLPFHPPSYSSTPQHHLLAEGSSFEERRYAEERAGQSHFELGGSPSLY